MVNLSGDGVTLNTDLTDPNQRVNVDRKEVKSIELSTVSPMPPMLLAMLKKDEILDLVGMGQERYRPVDTYSTGMRQRVKLAQALTIPVIASGGLSNLADIEKLCAVESEGIEGVICGRAIYSGDLDFAQAQARADELNG